MKFALIAGGIILSLTIAGLICCRFFWQDKEQITTTSFSPDETIKAELVDLIGDIDRNFYVRLSCSPHFSPVTVFRSPDEGVPIGTERFIWSKDGQYLLLIGKHFFLKRSCKFQSGDEAYLLIHVPSGQVWCNAPQQSLQSFGEPELTKAGFIEAIQSDCIK